MKILFCGGKLWGRDALEILLANVSANNGTHQIVGVVANNSEFSAPVYAATIYDLAVAHKLPLFVPQTSTQIVDVIKQTQPDLILSIFYDRVFSAEALALAPSGGINLHMADTARYRGCYPTLHALLNHDKEFGVTLHYMTASVDDGDIIDKAMWAIDETTTGYDLYMQAEKQGVALLKKHMAGILTGIAPRKPEISESAQYYRRVLPQKVFTAEEVAKNPAKFFDSARTFDFYGFEGVSLRIGTENYVLYNQRYLDGVTWNKKIREDKS